jgi:hypothetical protein
MLHPSNMDFTKILSIRYGKGYNILLYCCIFSLNKMRLMTPPHPEDMFAHGDYIGPNY